MRALLPLLAPAGSFRRFLLRLLVAALLLYLAGSFVGCRRGGEPRPQVMAPEQIAA